VEDLIVKLIPLVIPIVVLLVKKVVPLLPTKYLPATVGLSGLAFGALTGQTDGELTQFLGDILSGGTVALAGIGVHQVSRQAKKKGNE